MQPTGKRAKPFKTIQPWRHLRNSVQRLEDTTSRVLSLVAITSCSVRVKASVTALFQRVCEAHLYPLRPLYNHVSLHLRSKAIRAFKRIFQLCDADGNGALDDAELQAFQLLCYGHPFTPEDLEGVKQVRRPQTRQCACIMSPL